MLVILCRTAEAARIATRPLDLAVHNFPAVMREIARVFIKRVITQEVTLVNRAIAHRTIHIAQVDRVSRLRTRVPSPQLETRLKTIQTDAPIDMIGATVMIVAVNDDDQAEGTQTTLPTRPMTQTGVIRLDNRLDVEVEVTIGHIKIRRVRAERDRRRERETSHVAI